MDTLTVEQARRFGQVSGAADVAGEAVGSLRALASVVLAEEGFAAALDEELTAIRKRLGQIEGDLGLLAMGGGADPLYRLAHRGQDRPEPATDRAQLEAIEGRAAA